ncbi:MAG: murein biosynthesis integral membrane protein MurJ [Candidatus Coatesbacteria bacterium]|nr:murein biosynthesis integral membrane protein MurJ [Candidatus Coatesbacteria bacterium]
MKLSLKKALFSTSILTALARVFGFIREVVFLALFGSSQITDVYLFAFRLTNLFRQILGESNADSAFMPSFIQLYAKGEKAEAWRLARSILGYLIIFSIIAMLSLFFLFPPLAHILAPGFPKETLPKLIWYVKTMIPIIIMLALSAYAGAILQAFKRFSPVYFAPALSSIGFILVLYLYKQKLGDNVLAYAILTGSLLQMIFMWIFLVPVSWKAEAFSFGRIKGKVKGLRQVARLSIPILFSTALEKLASQVDLLFASLLEVGSITALYSSYRLFHLPFAIVGLTIGKVYLPYLSKDTVEKDFNFFVKRLNEAIRLNFILLVPVIVFIVMLAEQIVNVIYQRGSFDARASGMTSFALQCYAPGLLPTGLIAILSSAFHSNLNTKKPVIAAAIGMALNIIFNYILMHTFLTYGGLALGTSLAFMFQTALLYIWFREFARKKGVDIMQKDDFKFLLRLLLVNILPSLSLIPFYIFFPYDKSIIIRASFLIAASIIFTLFFLASGLYLFPIQEIKDSLLSRKDRTDNK